MRLLLAAIGAIGAVGATETAEAATWEPVRGTVPDRPVDAARDGSGVLVLTRGRAALTVGRVAGGRVGPGQVVTRDRRVRQARVLSSPHGAAVVVWSMNGEILASRRPPGPPGSAGRRSSRGTRAPPRAPRPG